MNIYFPVSLAMLFILPILAQADSTARWYSKDQVEQGRLIFSTHCASCHGKNAESTPMWTKPDAQGHLPPPPLNGTAHAWHHPMKALRLTINKGGLPVGGMMPAFEDKLSATEIDAVIAWFQSLWPEELYDAWYRNNTSTDLQAGKSATRSKNHLTEQLRRRLPNTKIGEPEATPIEGVSQARVGPTYAYLLQEGRYAIIGELIDLKTGESLTEQSKEKDTLKVINQFPETDMVVYQAKGKTQQAITILTDTECTYCRKLHSEVPKLLKAGIKVRYIPFPRGGKTGKGYSNMQAVWCAKDRTSAMDIAKGIKSGTLENKNCPAASIIDRGYELGLTIGLRGTPTIILENGHILSGYVPADELIHLSRSNQKPQ